MGGTAVMLADLISNIQKKHIVLAAVGMVGLILIITILTGGFLLVRSPAETVTGFSQRTDKTDAPKDPITIGKGSWSLVFLGFGDYHIEFSSGNKKALYQPSVGFLSFQTLEISLKNQLRSQSLGLQNSDCLVQVPGSDQLAFYGCNKSIESSRTVSLTEDGYNFSDFPTGNSVAPYKDGLLQVDDFSSDVTARISAARYENNQIVLNETNSIFEAGEGASQLVTDRNNAANSRFVYYDQENNRVYLFKDLNDIPRELDIAKYTEQKEGFTLDFYIEDDTLYIYNGLRHETGPGFGDDEAVTSEDAEGQTISALNFDSLDKQEQIPLPSDLLLDRFAIQEGSVAFSAYNLEGLKYGLYIMHKGNEKPRLSFYGQMLDLCYNEGKLYYLSDENAIYEYDSSNRTSHLLYESLNHNPANLNCLYETVSFPAQAEEGGDSDYTWTSLEQKPLGANQTRDEDTFPILEDSAYRISYGYLFKNTIYLVLNSNGLCGAIDDETKTTTLNHLKDLGINTASFTVDMRYDC